MRRFLIIAIFLGICGASAGFLFAEESKGIIPLPVKPSMPSPEDMVDGAILEEPVCFDVVNRAPYTVMGAIMSNYYEAEDGTKTRHRGNFRLEEGQKTNFCVLGPFFEGQKKIGRAHV